MGHKNKLDSQQHVLGWGGGGRGEIQRLNTSVEWSSHFSAVIH
jgi:hypothetical protein